MNTKAIDRAVNHKSLDVCLMQRVIEGIYTMFSSEISLKVNSTYYEFECRIGWTRTKVRVLGTQITRRVPGIPPVNHGVWRISRPDFRRYWVNTFANCVTSCHNRRALRGDDFWILLTTAWARSTFASFLIFILHYFLYTNCILITYFPPRLPLTST